MDIPSSESARVGPYDVVHSHVHHFNGYVLRLAYECAVPTRIAHSHTDTSSLRKNAGPARRVYLSLMERWIRQCSTYRLGVSKKAAEDCSAETG